VDQAPSLYTHDQPARRMAARYEEAAEARLAGDGLLYPRVWPQKSDTGLVSRPPGYPLFLAAVYRAVEPRFAAVQLVQNVLGAFLPVLLCLLVGALFGRWAGVLAGLASAIDAPLAYYSNVITPDALGTLTAVGVMGLVWWRGWRTRAALIAAGLLLGAATWLRPNFLLLGPAIAAGLLLATPGPRRRVAPWVLGLVGAAALVVAPVTVRNYRIYGELVPVSVNMGIVLWEGLADAGGERFGAHGLDWEVASAEAKETGDPRYAAWWASPDGIARDRERVRRSLAVIRAEPAWFLSATLRRGLDIVSYGLGGAAPVAAGSTARALLAPLQTMVAVAALPLALCGIAALAVVGPRRLLVMGLVPAYHLLTQMPLHYEPRFVLPMRPFVLGLAAVGALAVLGLLARYSRGMGWPSERRDGEGPR
jgi:hypothetical protein